MRVNVIFYLLGNVKVSCKFYRLRLPLYETLVKEGKVGLKTGINIYVIPYKCKKSTVVSL